MEKELGLAIGMQLQKMLLATTETVTDVRGSIEDRADRYAKKGDTKTANELRALSMRLEKTLKTFSDSIIGEMFSGNGDHLGEFSVLKYVQTEHSEAFRQFCQENNLQADEQAANGYLDLILKEEENAHTDGLD